MKKFFLFLTLVVITNTPIHGRKGNKSGAFVGGMLLSSVLANQYPYKDPYRYDYPYGYGYPYRYPYSYGYRYPYQYGYPYNRYRYNPRWHYGPRFSVY